MQEQLYLKRDLFLKNIRRQKINQITTARRQQIIAAQDQLPQNFLQSQDYKQILIEITNRLKEPYNLSRNLNLLETLSSHSVSLMAQPEVLNYIKFLSLKKYENDLLTEEQVKIQLAVGELMYRFLQTRQKAATAIIDKVMPILQITQNIELYHLISTYTNDNVKRVSYKIFLQALNRSNIKEPLQVIVSETFLNYIIKDPKIPYTSALQMMPYLLKRLQSQELSSEEYLNYINALLDITRVQHQIYFMNNSGDLIKLIMNYFSKTNSQDCMCVTLQFLAMMFKGSDELSLDIFRKNYNLLPYIQEKILTVNPEVTKWCLYVLCNMCANGQEIIKQVFKTNIINGIKHVYVEGTHKIQAECIYLIYVICQISGDRYRMILYENQVMNLIVTEIESGKDVDCLHQCLKCIRKMLQSAVRINSLQTHYTAIIKNDLDSKRIGFRERLESLITHPELSISNEARIILADYLDHPQLE